MKIQLFLDGVNHPIIFSSLTKPVIINNDQETFNYFSSIASITRFESFQFSDRLASTILNRMEILHLRVITLVIVIKDDTLSSCEDDKNQINWRIYGDSVTQSFNLCVVSLEYFRNKGYTNLLYNRIDNKNHYIYGFIGMSWFDITVLFKTLGLIVSGGSNTKKHLLSLNQLKLSEFLICLNDPSVKQSIVDSIHGDEHEELKKHLDLESSEFKKRFKKVIKKSHNPFWQSTSNKNNKNNNNNNKSFQDYKPNLTRDYHTSSSVLNFPTLNHKVGNHGCEAAQVNNTISQFLESIKYIIHSDKDKKESQKIIESTWVSLIEDKLQDETYLLNNQQFLLLKWLNEAKLTLSTMQKKNYLVRTFPYFGNKLNEMKYIIIAYTICLSLYNRLSYNSLVYKVGDDITYQYFITNSKYFIDENKPSYLEFKQELSLTFNDIVKIGEFFINLLCNFPHDIFEREILVNSYYSKEPYRLSISSQAMKEMQLNVVINPTTLPMICIPNEWSDSQYGGYLMNDNRKASIITGSSNHKHLVEDKSNLFKAINKMNKTEFTVNSLLLDYLNNEGNYLLDSIKPENKLQRDITLQVANVYNNTVFYLPLHSDWRGRLYTQSFFLTYQGGDLSNALLNFYQGESVDDIGKFYLYIHGANNHNINNISKDSFIDRINWVKDNYDKIIHLDRELILSAENPFIFTSFCLNMKQIHENPLAIIKTPVFLDATCSGIQHLAALLKDLELGTNVNLIKKSFDEKPNDIYSEMVDPINKAINKYGEENIEYSQLSLAKLDRKILKRSIMTKVYNVSQFGISKQLQSNLETIEINKNTEIKNIQDNLQKSLKNKKMLYIAPGIDGKNVHLNTKEIYQIAKIINDQIFVLFPSLNNIYNYFIEVTNTLSKLNIVLTWITPSGLKITQNYQKTKKKVIAISMFGKSKKMIFREGNFASDNRKQSQAIIPNIIHSLDASHLINLINKSSDEHFKPIITIHDCFGTLPNKMGELEHRVKKEFILLYSNNNFLETFHNRMIQSIKDNQYSIIDKKGNLFALDKENESEYQIPNVPKLGKLDLENIINSKYMIS